MNDPSNAAPRMHGHLLWEEGHTKLQEIRDQLSLLASVTFAAALEEEHAPLEVRRSMLG